RNVTGVQTCALPISAAGCTVIGVMLAGIVSLVVAILGTPVAIRVLAARGYGQLIRDDGPTTHQTKRGTPTMGGAVIIIAVVCGFLVAHLTRGIALSASVLLVLLLLVGLGLVGFLDGYFMLSK